MGCTCLEEDTPIVNGPYPIGEREEGGQRREERRGEGEGGEGEGERQEWRGGRYT